MFKKTGDNVHYLERTGSHSTKGMRRGTVWWNTTDPEAFDPIAERTALRQRRRGLERQISALFIESAAVHAMSREAVSNGDLETVRALRPALRAFRKIVGNLEKEISLIKEKMRDLPRPPKKIRSVKTILMREKYDRRNERRRLRRINSRYYGANATSWLKSALSPKRADYGRPLPFCCIDTLEFLDGIGGHYAGI